MITCFPDIVSVADSIIHTILPCQGFRDNISFNGVAKFTVMIDCKDENVSKVKLTVYQQYTNKQLTRYKIQKSRVNLPISSSLWFRRVDDTCNQCYEI